MPCSEEAEASRADAAAAGGALERSTMSSQYGQLAVWALTYVTKACGKSDR